MNELSKNLIELSQVVEKRNHICLNASIVPIIELGEGFSLPLRFKARVLEPGTYKGFTFKKEDIIRNMNTIFKVNGNVANNELNVDHKSNRKIESSINDLVGRVSAVEFNDMENSLFMDCEVTDRGIAEKIYHGSLKYVSLRINPLTFDLEFGEKIAREFDFEELSIVRLPGYHNALITNVQS